MNFNIERAHALKSLLSNPQSQEMTLIDLVMSKKTEDQIFQQYLIGLVFQFYKGSAVLHDQQHLTPELYLKLGILIINPKFPIVEAAQELCSYIRCLLGEFSINR